jgi:hypothetical protein
MRNGLDLVPGMVSRERDIKNPLTMWRERVPKFFKSYLFIQDLFGNAIILRLNCYKDQLIITCDVQVRCFF